MSKKEKKDNPDKPEVCENKNQTQTAEAVENEAATDLNNPVEPEVVQETEKQLENKPSEVDLLKDKYLRLQADFDNYRKRMVRERQETILRANEDLLGELLVPMDHMDHALAAMRKANGVADDDPCVKGVEIVKSELLSTLGKFGVKIIEADKEAFDPNKHEALGKMQVPGKAEDEIVAVVRAGYTLNGKVLRAAQVMLAAGDPAVSAKAEDLSAATEEK